MTATVILPEPAARILLKPPSEHPGMVNGAWWPRSRDLVRELPLLVAALDGVWGQIHHVTVQVHMWPDIPKRVRTGKNMLRVGWFDAEQDPHDICLLSVPGRGRWDLLVVPPELDPETSARLMATAASPGNMQTASSLIAAASAPPAWASRDAERITAWESEGGHDLVRA
jgi:hypothetical protein